MPFPIELSSIVLSALGGIVWLVRLEGKLLAVQEKAKELTIRVQKLDEKHDALDSKIMDKLSYIERSLSRLEGRFLSDKKEG
jgi:hypothetical protein